MGQISVGANMASAQTTVGTGAYAQSGTAIGAGASQVDVTYDSSYGTLAGKTFTKGIAIGEGTSAAGNDIVIGSGLSAPFDGNGGSKFVIGGLQSDGQVVYRRMVGVAAGYFQNDGANLGQVWEARDAAISTSNRYTDASLEPVTLRLGNAETVAGNAYTLATTNSARLDAHDVQLANHEMRITNLEGMVGGFDNRLTALESMVNQTRKQAFQGVAAVAAMNVEVPALAPGEQAVVAGVGAYGGQAALAVGYVRSNYAGQVFSAKVGVSGGRAAVSAGGGWKF